LRFDNDATQLRAEPFDTGRTRSALRLDGPELPHDFRTTIAFAQQFAPPITPTDAGVASQNPPRVVAANATHSSPSSAAMLRQRRRPSIAWSRIG
jgi:hypothetical protein